MKQHTPKPIDSGTAASGLQPSCDPMSPEDAVLFHSKAERSGVLQGCPPSATCCLDARAAGKQGADSSSVVSTKSGSVQVVILACPCCGGVWMTKESYRLSPLIIKVKCPTCKIMIPIFRKPLLEAVYWWMENLAGQPIPEPTLAAQRQRAGRDNRELSRDGGKPKM